MTHAVASVTTVTADIASVWNERIMLNENLYANQINPCLSNSNRYPYNKY